MLVNESRLRKECYMYLTIWASSMCGWNENEWRLVKRKILNFNHGLKSKMESWEEKIVGGSQKLLFFEWGENEKRKTNISQISFMYLLLTKC